MDRRDLIKEEGNRFMQPVLHSSMAALMEEYKKNEKEILQGFQNTLEKLYLTAAEMQMNRGKEALSFMGICYCLSSAYTGNYEFRLDVYDKAFYLDENECCVYWKPDFINTYLERDIAFFRKTIKKKVPKVREYEEQQFVIGYMRNYMYIVLEFLRQRLPEVLGRIKREDVKISEDFKVFFGEYMGKCTIIAEYV